MSKLTIIVILTLCLGACAPKHNDYSKFLSLPSKGWAYGDTVSFRPADLDSVASRRLALAIRHSNDYPYSNLWLEVTLSDSAIIRRDTVNMLLADRFGRWKGNGIGPSIQTQTIITSGIDISDSTQIHIRHIMRLDTLKGIEQIGITVYTPKAP